jgi:hypothetical protein
LRSSFGGSSFSPMLECPVSAPPIVVHLLSGLVTRLASLCEYVVRYFIYVFVLVASVGMVWGILSYGFHPIFRKLTRHFLLN